MGIEVHVEATGRQHNLGMADILGSERAERHELIPRQGVPTGHVPVPTAVPRRFTSVERRLHGMPGSGVHSGSFLPGAGTEMLRSRTDYQEIVSWQEGVDADKDEESAEETRQAGKLPDIPMVCGADKRPFFPAVLVVSLLWSVAMLSVQSSFMADMFGGAFRWTTAFLLVYIVTIVCMAYTALADPGTMSEDMFVKWQAKQVQLPARAHKHWLYRRPILRFHQYCRWVTNCVGLRNHREYMIMVAGFVIIAVTDVIVDSVLFIARLTSGSWVSEIIVLAHLIYSGYFAYYTIPLLRLHSAFVFKNELTQEWKTDDFYVVPDKVTGEPVWVNDLDEEEFDDRFDEFQYDPSRNRFDKGWQHNCWVFWCTPRHDPTELGEF
eukprot:TRINITY_DN75410_c0_g1_i1.p1 TRINITY_DN75410_c0_g1~~TRINITY_DN75410_c0_g1_i1.p1  ORF type:complete len:380 (-),score=55.49 TRINITY_DN75410_c0_g1_i1:38-1177(-)